jgi:hypothetical protein
MVLQQQYLMLHLKVHFVGNGEHVRADFGGFLGWMEKSVDRQIC